MHVMKEGCHRSTGMKNMVIQFLNRSVVNPENSKVRGTANITIIMINLACLKSKKNTYTLVAKYIAKPCIS